MSLSTGMTPRAAAVWPSGLGRSAPGSAHTQVRLDCTSQQNCTVAGRRPTNVGPASTAREVTSGPGGGGARTKRRSRPGRWRVTTAIRTSSAERGAPALDASPAEADRGASGPRLSARRFSFSFSFSSPLPASSSPSPSAAAPTRQMADSGPNGRGAHRVVAGAAARREPRDRVRVGSGERDAEGSARHAHLRRGLERVHHRAMRVPLTPRLPRASRTSRRERRSTTSPPPRERCSSSCTPHRWSATTCAPEAHPPIVTTRSPRACAYPCTLDDGAARCCVSNPARTREVGGGEMTQLSFHADWRLQYKLQRSREVARAMRNCSSQTTKNKCRIPAA